MVYLTSFLQGICNLEYTIYCDESTDQGLYCSNFYGGALVRSLDLEHVLRSLEYKKKDLNLLGEVKWQKVTYNYLEKYILLMDEFFTLL